VSPENLQLRESNPSLPTSEATAGTGAKGVALLKLRKVELLGFKSFCEKTAITFSGDGITCIVGPNGCGKSNIVDAMSWVLGEQSHKSLRAERMSDCIFNGTQKRPPMGMSEVMLTLEDPELSEAARFVLEKEEVEEVEEKNPSIAARRLVFFLNLLNLLAIHSCLLSVRTATAKQRTVKTTNAAASSAIWRGSPIPIVA